MPQGSVLWLRVVPSRSPASMEEIQVGVSMLNDDSARAKAPGGPRRSGGWTAGRRPHRLPPTPSVRIPFPAASVSDRMARFAGTSRVSSTNRFRWFLQGQTPGSTQIQPRLIWSKVRRSRWRRKIACADDFMIWFKGTAGLLWSYALNLTQRSSQDLTVPCGDVKVAGVNANKNTVRPPGRTPTADVCPITSLAGEKRVSPRLGSSRPAGGNGPSGDNE
jgi:hypothetical protein